MTFNIIRTAVMQRFLIKHWIVIITIYPKVDAMFAMFSLILCLQVIIFILKLLFSYFQYCMVGTVVSRDDEVNSFFYICLLQCQSV